MSRGLGKTQRALMKALETLEREMKRIREEQVGVPTTELAARIYGKGKTYTKSQHSSTSRALHKLAKEKLVTKVGNIDFNESCWRINPKAAVPPAKSAKRTTKRARR